MSAKTVPHWKVLSASVRGASHERKGQPNQDAVLVSSGKENPGHTILTVSDGHGSSKSFRSHLGSKFAAEASTEAIKMFLESNSDPGSVDLSALKRLAEENLPRDVVKIWHDKVADDLAAQPFSAEDLCRLAERDGENRRRQVTLEPVLAYGATVISLCITEDFLFYLQLGDGDIVTVSPLFEPFRPLPEDKRLFANETTSLCAKDAWKDFRFGFQALPKEPPPLIFLSTDGYVNSFADDTSFLKVPTDIIEMIRKDGFDEVETQIFSWLEATTKRGSGDDISVAIACRPDLLVSADGPRLVKN